MNITSQTFLEETRLMLNTYIDYPMFMAHIYSFVWDYLFQQLSQAQSLRNNAEKSSKTIDTE